MCYIIWDGSDHETRSVFVRAANSGQQTVFKTGQTTEVDMLPWFELPIEEKKSCQTVGRKRYQIVSAKAFATL